MTHLILDSNLKLLEELLDLLRGSSGNTSDLRSVLKRNVAGTVENLNAISQLQLRKKRESGGSRTAILATDSRCTLADLAYALETNLPFESLPADVLGLVPGLTMRDWTALTRALTLLTLALEKRIVPVDFDPTETIWADTEVTI